MAAKQKCKINKDITDYYCTPKNDAIAATYDYGLVVYGDGSRKCINNVAVGAKLVPFCASYYS